MFVTWASSGIQLHAVLECSIQPANNKMIVLFGSRVQFFDDAMRSSEQETGGNFKDAIQTSPPKWIPQRLLRHGESGFCCGFFDQKGIGEK